MEPPVGLEVERRLHLGHAVRVALDGLVGRKAVAFGMDDPGRIEPGRREVVVDDRLLFLVPQFEELAVFPAPPRFLQSAS